MASCTVRIFSASSSGISMSKCFLERHHQFDRVERVGAQIVDKGRAGCDFAFVDAQLLGDDLLYLLVISLSFSPDAIRMPPP